MRTAETERIACLIPKGRRNAISREDLAAALHATDRKMRKAVAEAKKQGVMICNDGDGYYQSDELSDLRFHQDELFAAWEAAVEEQEQYEQSAGEE